MIAPKRALYRLSPAIALGLGLTLVVLFGFLLTGTKSSATAALPANQASPESPPGIITATGRHLERDGVPFKVRGMNYYPKDYAWDRFWVSYTQASPQIDAELDLAKHLGINAVRIFLPYERFDDSEKNAPYHGYLTDFMDRLWARDMVAIVTLFDFYPSASPAPYSTTDYLSSTRHIDAVVHTLGITNPAILAWDLKNELDRDYTQFGAAPVKAWAREMITYTRQADPNHLITLGFYGVVTGTPCYDPTITDTLIYSPAIAAEFSSTVDLVSLHYFLSERCYESDLQALQSQIGDKPLVLEEFGLHTMDSGADRHTETEQAAYYNALLFLSEAHDVAGYLFWTLSDFSYILTDSEETHHCQGILRNSLVDTCQVTTTLDYTEKPAADTVRRHYNEHLHYLDLFDSWVDPKTDQAPPGWSDNYDDGGGLLRGYNLANPLWSHNLGKIAFSKSDILTTGLALSPILTNVNVDRYPFLSGQVFGYSVRDITNGSDSTLHIGVKKDDARITRLLTVTRATSLPYPFSLDLRQPPVGWSGSQSFQIVFELVPAGQDDGYSATYEFDWIALAQAMLTPDSAIRYVARTGNDSSNDCTRSSTSCATIQHAVDVAGPGDEIRVATGVYTDVHARTGITQVVYISKTVTVRGGYTTTDWNTSNPISYPTTLDAQGRGRVLYVTGDVSPTIEGLHITGGDATGLGGSSGVIGGGNDAGGGIYVVTSTIVLSDNQVFGNAAYHGGGVFFYSSVDAVLNDNVFRDNSSNNLAAGLYFRNSPGAILTANVISNNFAGASSGQQRYGGALFENSDDATLFGNVIQGNHSDNQCGGICFTSGSENATLTRNEIVDNSAGIPGSGFVNSASGGLGLLGHSSALLTQNRIEGNSSTTYGGGVYLERSDVTMVNNVIVDNQITTNSSVTGSGSGLYSAGSSPLLLHTTIARNSGGDGSGVYVTDIFGQPGAVALTNTLLVSHTVGITVAAGNTATLNGVLWYGNTVNAGGEGAITVTNAYTGDPAFAADGYHLTAFSQAIDKGVEAGVGDDIDGDPRPADGDFDTVAKTDVGVDEFLPDPSLTVTKRAAFHPAQLGSPLTFTLHVTNTGNVSLTATITDVLPPGATPTGTLTWTPVTLSVGSAWTKTVVVTPGLGLCESTNRVQVTTAEGATGAAKESLKVLGIHCLHLPIMLKNGPVTRALSRLTSPSPTLQLLAYQSPRVGQLFTFTVRLNGALSHTQYVISSYHHTDVDYWQDAVTVTTDGDGVASARVRSRCRVGDVLSGTVFAKLSPLGAFQTHPLDCPALQTIDGYGSHSLTDPANDDWVYRPSPPGPERIYLWVRDAAGRSGLTGSVRIRSAATGYELSETLADKGGGLYAHVWSIAGLPRADDYRVQLTLDDGEGGLSGLDAWIKLSGRATWVWGEAVGAENPIIWAILTNGDHDGDGLGDRDEWLAFADAPYDGALDPYATTSYFSIYPYISYDGTVVTDTFQTFLSAAHASGELRVEALAGTHRWVESDAGLQDGKDLCDAVLDFNRASGAPAQRFDGIHYDVEHDDWHTGARWDRFIELITYCQAQVDLYNQTHAPIGPIVFGVDVPPHFGTGPGSTGAVKSGWDVLSIVDYVTLMDYRDFADVRRDGRTDGIIPRAEAFIADGNALGKSVVIGVELTPNPYDHVTFFEECAASMERELRRVSQHFAADRAYQGIAIHSYAAWRAKAASRCIYLPIVLDSHASKLEAFFHGSGHSTSGKGISSEAWIR